MAKRPTGLHTDSRTVFYRCLRSLGGAAACAILVGVLAACVEQEKMSVDKQQETANVLRYNVNAPFTSLDPAAASASGSTHIFPMLYSYLWVPDTKGALIPDLAEKWAFDSEKQRWTIHLRNNARFHDNKEVSATDVKRSIKDFIDHHRPQLNASIDRIIATSDKLLTLHLKQDDPNLLYKLWDIEIVPHLGNKTPDIDTVPIGSGPFKYESRQGHQMVTLTANPSYYGKPPELDRIVYYYQPDRELAWTRLLSGATDIAHEISAQNYNITHQYKDRFYFDTYTMRYFTILLYNTQDPLFHDVNVRKALTLGINRRHIVAHILNGFGRIATGPMGVNSPFQSPHQRPMPFDPGRSKRLLNQAGWLPDDTGRLKKDGKPFEFTILVYRESDVEMKVAQFIQLCLDNLGIKAVVQASNYEAVKTSYLQNSQFQAVLTEMEGAYRNPSAIKKIWSSGDHGKSYAGCFNNPKTNHLIENAFTDTTPSEKKVLLQQLDLLISSLHPGTFLFQKTAIDAMSKRFHLVHDFTLTLEGVYRLKDASIDEAHTP